MTLLSILPANMVHDLGWTLLHFLWQGLLGAAALELALAFTRSARARHDWALGALVLMLAAPVATFFILQDWGGAPPAGGAAVTLAAGAGAPLALVLTPAAPSPWSDWVVLAWIAGVAALSLRALGGWVLVESLKRQGTLALPADLMERCHALQLRLAVTRPVRFLQSLRVTTPVVVGWLRPVIVLPVSAVCGLAPLQLDALILHELAHIRRHDAFINALLLAAETVLFYHPAIWWVSRRIRIEREHCCDDLAVGSCGDAALYVEALATLEAGRLPPGLALAAGGRLKERAARLLGAPAQARRHSLGAITGLAAVTLVAISVALAQPEPLAPAQAPAIQVPENAIAGNVGIAGYGRLSARDLTHEIHVKAGDAITRAAVEADIVRLQELYRRNGKYFARIEPGFTRNGSRTDIVYTITEGPTVGIGRIAFSGNKAFDAATLKSQIATRESAWYRPWPFEKDDNYDSDRVMYDRELLRRFYANRGYADFKITNVAVQLEPGGRAFDLTYTLDEGQQYRIGQVTINAKTAVLPQASPLFYLHSGDIYNQGQLKTALDLAPPQVRVHLQRDPGGKPVMNMVIDVEPAGQHAALQAPGGGNAAILPAAALKTAQGPNQPAASEAFLAITDDKGVQPPIDIRADRVRNDAQGRPTRFEGNAIMHQGGITIRADSIRAEVAPAAPPSGGKLTRLIADGNVVLTQNGKSVRSDHLEVDVADNELRPEPPAAAQDHAALSDAMKLQMARQQHVTVSPAEVDARIAELRAKGSLPPASDLEALRARIVAQLAWEKTTH